MWKTDRAVRGLKAVAFCHLKIFLNGQMTIVGRFIVRWTKLNVNVLQMQYYRLELPQSNIGSNEVLTLYWKSECWMLFLLFLIKFDTRRAHDISVLARSEG